MIYLGPKTNVTLTSNVNVELIIFYSLSLNGIIKYCEYAENAENDH